MSAERLREAAKLLRERVSDASLGPWLPVGIYGVNSESEPDCFRFIADLTYPRDNAYVATMHPGVGLALADWLDVTAQDCGTSTWTFHRGLAVANAILAGAS